MSKKFEFMQWVSDSVGVDPVLDQSTPLLSRDVFVHLCEYDNAYFYTITLDRRWQGMDIHHQYNMLRLKIEIYLHRHTFYFVPELTEQGVIHLHGIVLPTSDTHRRLLNRFIRYNFGKMYKCYKVRSPDKLYDYVTKSDVYKMFRYRIDNRIQNHTGYYSSLGYTSVELGKYI